MPVADWGLPRPFFFLYPRNGTNVHRWDFLEKCPILSHSVPFCSNLDFPLPQSSTPAPLPENEGDSFQARADTQVYPHDEEQYPYDGGGLCRVARGSSQFCFTLEVELQCRGFTATTAFVGEKA